MSTQMSISDGSGASSSRPRLAGRAQSTRFTEASGRSDAAFLKSDNGASFQGFPPVRGIDAGVVDPQASPPDPDPPGPEPHEPVAGERPCIQWVLWEGWYTQQDERVCPECGPLHGQWFRQGEGPQPPLHRDCRCFRQLIHRECVARQAGGAGVGENY